LKFEVWTEVEQDYTFRKIFSEFQKGFSLFSDKKREMIGIQKFISEIQPKGSEEQKVFSECRVDATIRGKIRKSLLKFSQNFLNDSPITSESAEISECESNYFRAGENFRMRVCSMNFLNASPITSEPPKISE